MTSVRAFLLPNETVVATEAISGYVSVDGPSNVQWPVSLEDNLDEAFRKTALNRYVQMLQDSDDAALQQTHSIEVGLPLDLLNADSNSATGTGTGTGPGSGSSNSNGPSMDSAAANAFANTNDDNVEDVGWTIAGFTISLTLLAIIAASVAVLSVVLLFCVWWRMRVVRKQTWDNTAAEHDDELSQLEEQAGRPDDGASRSRKSKRSQKTEKTRNGNTISKSKRSSLQTSDTSPTNSDLDPSQDQDPTMQKYFQKYVHDAPDDDNRSLATSTYSYIDSNLHHHAAPSFLYGNDDVRYV
jgi:hypothetical protein